MCLHIVIVVALALILGTVILTVLCPYRSGMKSSSMVCTMRPPSRAHRVLSPPLIPATPSSILALSGLKTSASTSAMLACLQRNLRLPLCLLSIASDSSVPLCQTSVGHNDCHAQSTMPSMVKVGDGRQSTPR